MKKIKEFQLTNEDGYTKNYKVILTFEDERKNNYILYTNNTYDSSGKINVFASKYNPNLEYLELESIIDDSDWKVVEEVIKKITN